MASLSPLRFYFGNRRSVWSPREALTVQLGRPTFYPSLPGLRFFVKRSCCTARGFRAWAPRASVEAAGTVQDKKERRMREDDEVEGRPLRVGIVCGGPSAERGISLNSARSVLDHIQGEDLHVSCYYIDPDFNAYGISSAQLYSNTPADFDFKLGSLAHAFGSLTEFAQHLASSVDIVFPVIHGCFGEDGGIQELLEKENIPFVGTPSVECREAFDKYNASVKLRKEGFVTVPSFLIQINHADKNALAIWFETHHLDKVTGKVVVKPTRAGSSIGVSVAYGVDDSFLKAIDIISQGIDNNVIIEIFLGGREFTAIVIDVGEGDQCEPVTLLPTEVELCGSNDDDKETIFNYRRKYLPTHQVAYHTPPHFPIEVIDFIRHGAALVFKRLKLREFARIDGWFLPSSVNLFSSSENGCDFGKTKFGTIIFTDINLISGMEQTSFMFQQASKVGFSHSNILRTIIHRACLRFPSLVTCRKAWSALSQTLKLAKNLEDAPKRKVFVIFGGKSSERQVSLMSGTNIWLNLRTFDDLDVVPCMLAPADGYRCSTNGGIDKVISSEVVWSLPYSLVLRHTTEEVFASCLEVIEPQRAILTSQLCKHVMTELLESLSKHDWFSGFDIIEVPPLKFTLRQWIMHAKEAEAIVYIAVHGDIGEDGTLQSFLEAAGIPYTGPGSISSSICMDKVSTSHALENMKSLGIHTLPKDVKTKDDLINSSITNIWHNLTVKLESETLCVKPARDGCSTGVAMLSCEEDLKVYVSALKNFLPRLPSNCLSKVHGVIEMPNPAPEFVIFEPFVETDDIIISSKSISGSTRHITWKGQSEWVEVTVGVMGSKGDMHSLSPSITVKESGAILSLEEKFQGGTGVNLTPPPTMIVSNEALQKCKQRIEIIANTLGLEGISRIDAFVNTRNGEVLVIEVNTVPGMTPSTVLIHQGLAEQPPLYPRNFFRRILDSALQKAQ